MKITDKEINEAAQKCASTSQILSSYPYNQPSVEYGFKKGVKWAIQKLQPEWIKETERKPSFGRPVLVWCRIYGRYITTYDSIDPVDPKCVYGNWYDPSGEFGGLPPVYWMELPEQPKV